MRRIMIASLIGCSLVSGAFAEPPTALDLQFTLSVDDRLVGSPRLLVRPGAPSEISVAGDDGGGYHFQVRADPPATPTEPASIVLTTALHARIDGTWRTLGEPTLQIALDGRPASIQIGATGSNPAHYRIDVSARIADAQSLARPISGH